MKHTEGFVTDDGTFFEEENEAKLYEAEMALRAELAHQFPKIPQENFFAVVLGVLPQIREYINAYDANLPRVEPDPESVREEVDHGEPPPPHVHPAYITGTEEDLASILKLPTRRHSHVPDVGSGAQSEEVPNGGSVDGARSRERNA